MQTVNISTRKDLSDSFEKFMKGEAKGKIVLPCPVTNILKREPVEEEICLVTGIDLDEWKISFVTTNLWWSIPVKRGSGRMPY